MMQNSRNHRLFTTVLHCWLCPGLSRTDGFSLTQGHSIGYRQCYRRRVLLTCPKVFCDAKPLSLRSKLYCPGSAARRPLSLHLSLRQ
ncbi:hypothetical protein F5141DRAFT_427593 [Pisolithus sp. B1]|nr:hypothetical protein F5141DRAFT_427593 [Pisolithus sp. B1]